MQRLSEKTVSGRLIPVYDAEVHFLPKNARLGSGRAFVYPVYDSLMLWR